MAATPAERMAAMRARRAAGLEAAPEVPRDQAEPLLAAVEVTIGALDLGARGAALAQLARAVASAIDGAQAPAAALVKLGPVLLKVLTAMQATPASRPARPSRGRAPEGRPNPIAQMRHDHLMRTRKPETTR